jgi:hypothetical protein
VQMGSGAAMGSAESPSTAGGVAEDAMRQKSSRMHTITSCHRCL